MEVELESSFGPRISGSLLFLEISTIREQTDSTEYNFGEDLSAKETGGEPLTLDQ